MKTKKRKPKGLPPIYREPPALIGIATREVAKGVADREFRRGLWQEDKPSVWKFWQDGVSSSLIALFLQCREQFRLSVIEGWKSRTEPIYFGFGTCGHWILKQAYQRAKRPGPKWLARQLNVYHKLWLRDVRAPTTRQLEQQDKIYALMERLLPQYFKRWAGDWLTDKYPRSTKVANPKKWTALEQQFTILFDFNLGGQEVVPIRGTRDGVFTDKHRKLWVFDSKFRSVINEEDILDTLALDLQQMLYLWATWKELGICPEGCILNVVRRPGHRLGKKELLTDFYDRVGTDIADRNRWDHYFTRYQLEISEGELAAWEREQLRPVLWDIRLWWEGKTPHYMNPNALISKYGRCELFLPIIKGVFDQCFKRDRGIMDYQGSLI